MDYVSSVCTATTAFVSRCVAKAKAEPIKTALAVIGLTGVICGVYHLASASEPSFKGFQSPICASSPGEDFVTSQAIKGFVANNQSVDPVFLYADQRARGVSVQLTAEQQRLAFGEGRDLSEQQTRLLYNAIVKPLASEESEDLLKRNSSLGAFLAVGAINTRAAARTYARERNSFWNQMVLERRDAWEYGFKMNRSWSTLIFQLFLGGNTGPTCEELSARNNHDPAKIITSSGRSNEKVNAKYGKAGS